MSLRRTLVLALAALLVCCAAAAAQTSSDLDMLTVTVVGPETVKAGEPFDLVINAGNLGDVPLTLDSIDVHDEWLAGIRIISSDPASIQDLFHIPVDNSVSFTLKKEIPAHGNLAVTFRAIGAQAGTFTGNFDVCTTPIVYKPVPITTTVTGTVPEGVVLPDGNYTELDVSGMFGDMSDSGGGDERHNPADLEFLEVSYEVQGKVKVGRPAQLLMQLKNTTDRPIFIDSIDVHDEFLANLTIQSVNPPSLQEPFHIPIDNSMSYTMKQTIPANGALEVKFTVVPNTKGEHAGNIDVCVTYSDCKVVPVSVKAR